jgi:hypothetical protein
MIEMLESGPGTLAAKISGKLSRKELGALVERTELSLATHEKTNVFIEVNTLEGVDPAGLADCSSRALAMVSKLARFGRIAVVTDQSWIRWLTRAESAMLPGISYEIFALAERERALAWVKGEVAHPHRPAVRIIETDDPNVLGFQLDGKVSTAEAHAIADFFGATMKHGRPIRLLGRIKAIGGAELGAFFKPEYIRMKWAMAEHLERYAIVGGPSWLSSWVSMIDSMLPGDVRHFAADAEAQAWKWLGARPVKESSLID